MSLNELFQYHDAHGAIFVGRAGQYVLQKHAETRDRTGDLQICSLTLSQLSYRGRRHAVHAAKYLPGWPRHGMSAPSSLRMSTPSTSSLAPGNDVLLARFDDVESGIRLEASASLA